MTGYNIYRSYNPSGPWTKLNPNPVLPADPGPGLTNAFLYSDSGLATGTEYFYYVASVISGTESRFSNVDSAVPLSSAVPWHTGDPAAVNDMAYVYTGGENGASGIDIGLQLGHTSPPNPGWAPFAFPNALRLRPPIIQGRYWVVPDQAIIMSLSTPGRPGVDDNSVVAGIRGHITNTVTGQTLNRIALITAAPGWLQANLGNNVLKRVNSIAQRTASIRADQFGMANGYLRNASVIRYSSWGDYLGGQLDGVQFNLTQWTRNLTSNQGSFVGPPLVNWIVQNEFFWEQLIELRTQ